MSGAASAAWSAVWDAALRGGEGGLGFSGPVAVIRGLSVPAASGRSGSIQKLPCLSHVFQRAVKTDGQGSAGLGKRLARGKNCGMNSRFGSFFPSDFFWATSHLGMFVKCLKKQESTCLCLHCQRAMPRHSMCTNHFFLFSFCWTVSDLQEEGKNAINSPLSPASVDLHPEETLLGTVGSANSLSWDSRAAVACTWCWPKRGVTVTAF